MMILRSAPASPFGRKVRIAAALLGLTRQIEVAPTDTGDPQDSIRKQNPLGKIPTLLLEDDTPIFDSRVILDFLDARAGGHRLFPADPVARAKTLTLAALCDGIMDAAILQVYEKRFREAERREPKWLAYQAEKISRALAHFEADVPRGSRDAVHIGLACALGYLDLRFEGVWRGDHPHLCSWLDGFAAEVPAFEATRFKDA
jgi:glutathione S-transferase